MLDTNICIYILNQKPARIIRKFRQFDMGDIGVSTITISELQYGAVKSKRPEQNKQRVKEFLSPLEIIPYDEAATDVYGYIRNTLEERGEPIGPLDLLIAAHAMSTNLTLVTNNEKEFRRVKALKVENWEKKAS
jgi:tRNA(fMet)-specific endonuclease VapC